MIFKPELIDAILAGRKTQTRRLVKPGEYLICADSYGEGYGDGPAIEVTSLRDRPDKYEMTNYSKWVVGRTYAVVPKRGQQTVWHNRSGVVHNGWCDWYYPPNPDMAAIALPVTHAELGKRGFRPLRIHITAIRQERLQAITEADAKAEGVGSVEEYRALWESINGKTPGARWADDPLCWVLTFEVVKEKGAQS